MKPSVKRIVSVFLVLFLLTVFLSCGRSDEPELFNSYDSSEGEWAKYSFYVDEFHYYEELNRKTMERTAYRLIKRNNETGELSHVCIDPVCSHEPYSDCPLTSLYRFYTTGFFRPGLPRPWKQQGCKHGTSWSRQQKRTCFKRRAQGCNQAISKT